MELLFVILGLLKRIKLWCGRRDLNPHGVTHQVLSLARLPIPPLPQCQIEGIINEKNFSNRKEMG